MAQHSHSNKAMKYKPKVYPPGAIRKVPADSVPYGDSISRNGETVWAVYNGETLIGVTATAEEARRKFIEWERSMRSPTPKNV